MLRDVNEFWARNFAHSLIFWGFWLGLFYFHQATLLAQSVVLTWSPSSDPQVVGYKIYSGTVSHDYTNVVNVGSTTNTTIFGLSANTTYYFAATAYDSAGNESSYSSEAAFLSPGAAPIVSAISANVSNLGTNPAVLLVNPGSVQLSATALASQNDAIAWQWLQNVNGGPQTVFALGSGTNPVVNFSNPVNAGRQYECLDIASYRHEQRVVGAISNYNLRAVASSTRHAD